MVIIMRGMLQGRDCTHAGSACADDGVDLINEEDDFAVGVRDFFDDGFEPVLKLAAVLGAGYQRAQVQRH